MKKRIITTVLTLCFVALALAGVAQAALDTGSFTNSQILSGATKTYPTVRARYYRNFARVTMTSMTNAGIISSIGDEPNVVPPSFHISYCVYNGDVTASVSKNISSGTVTAHYNQNYYQVLGHYYRLSLHNNNSFAVCATGTWCPDAARTNLSTNYNTYITGN